MRHACQSGFTPLTDRAVEAGQNRNREPKSLYPRQKVETMSRYFLQKSECSKHQIFPGVTIYTAAGEQMMLSYVELEPGAVVEGHSHPHEQVGMLLEGEAHFFVGDEDQVLRVGDMYRIPGGVPHRVVASEKGAKALDIFHPVREDYR